MRAVRRSFAPAACALALAAAVPALAHDPHPAEGWSSVGSDRVQITSAYGWQEPHLFHRNSMEAIVLLATVPRDQATPDRYLAFGVEPDRMPRGGGGTGRRRLARQRPGARRRCR